MVNNGTNSNEVPQRIIGAIADDFKVDFQTAKRWINKKDIRLTTDKAKQVFSQENFKWDEILKEAR